MELKLGHIKVNLKIIKFQERENSDGMKKKNILENGIIVNYADMVF